MPAEWEDYDNRSFFRCGPGEVSVACDPATDKWCAFAFDQPILDAENREAAKRAAEAEARRALWAGLKALGAPDIKRAIAAWFGEEGEFDTADYEADMRRAFDAGMESDNG